MILLPVPTTANRTLVQYFFGGRNRRQGNRRNHPMCLKHLETTGSGEQFICVSFYLSTITIERSQQVILPRTKLPDNRKVAKRDPLVITLLGRVYIALSLVRRFKTA